jgi:chromosome partitioning protein
MTKRIAFFNHKGGVSKTTSVYNVGWMLSRRYRVLVVDGDPQCNLTSQILGDNFEGYYLEDATKNENIKDGVKVAFEGKPTPIKAVVCKAPPRAPNLYLLAGHMTLSEYDAALTFAQTSNNAITTLQNLPGAFSELMRLTEEKYEIDFTLIDMNPSLSAINQNFFISSHAFIVPTNPDPFSIMALGTLETVLPKWVMWAQTMVPVFAESAYPLSGHLPKFLGTLIQRFNIRRGKAAKPYRDNIEEIKEVTRTRLITALRKTGMSLSEDVYHACSLNDGYCLEEIPDFQALLPKSFNAGVPVFDLSDEEIGETGPVLEQMQKKRSDFSGMFQKLCGVVETLLRHV